MKKNKTIFWVLGILLVTISIAFSQEEDVEGSKDHPLISRYPGSVIKAYDVKELMNISFHWVSLRKVSWQKARS